MNPVSGPGVVDANCMAIEYGIVARLADLHGLIAFVERVVGEGMKEIFYLNLLPDRALPAAGASEDDSVKMGQPN